MLQFCSAREAERRLNYIERRGEDQIQFTSLCLRVQQEKEGGGSFTCPGGGGISRSLARSGLYSADRRPKAKVYAIAWESLGLSHGAAEEPI